MKNIGFKRNFAFLCTALAVCGMIAACSPEDKLKKEDSGSTFVEAPKCNGKVKVFVPGGTKASSSYLEENRDDFTATRVDTKTDYTLVSYHGRPDADGKLKNIGMVQLISQRTGAVQSELVFTNARINFAQLKMTSKNGGVAYIGLDNNSGSEPFCGIVCVPVKENRFYLGETGDAELTPYQVDGVSINCIKNQFGDTDKIGQNILVVAAGGNAALGETGLAGFTKFQINPEDPTQLGVLAKKTSSNYRGYWFSFGYVNGAPLAYTYRTVEDGALVYRLGALPYAKGCDMFSNDVNSDFIDDYASTGAEIEVWRDAENDESFARFCTIALHKDYKIIAVSTGTKEGGVRLYRFAQKDAKTGTPLLTPIDIWPKAAVCLSTEVIIGGKYYVFAGCGDGVYKLRIDIDDSDKNAVQARIVPETKYTNIGETELGTPASINYMQVKGSGSNAQVHVAGGYKGYYALKFTDFEEGKPYIKPCDPRVD